MYTHSRNFGMIVDIAVVAIHTQSRKEQKYWHEHQHCANDIFQTAAWVL